MMIFRVAKSLLSFPVKVLTGSCLGGSRPKGPGCRLNLYGAEVPMLAVDKQESWFTGRAQDLRLNRVKPVSD